MPPPPSLLWRRPRRPERTRSARSAAGSGLGGGSCTFTHRLSHSEDDECYMERVSIWPFWGGKIDRFIGFVRCHLTLIVGVRSFVGALHAGEAEAHHNPNPNSDSITLTGTAAFLRRGGGAPSRSFAGRAGACWCALTWRRVASTSPPSTGSCSMPVGLQKGALLRLLNHTLRYKACLKNMRKKMWVKVEKYVYFVRRVILVQLLWNLMRGICGHNCNPNTGMTPRRSRASTFTEWGGPPESGGRAAQCCS